ncbi:G-protein coupled receptor 4-like [Chiloscyllium punctatum]|uniref:G-protein coupled receptor 4-like n=1 Tax=Chiloscyllium punctatum TaxID=137246 RepID=UPI003B641B16
MVNTMSNVEHCYNCSNSEGLFPIVILSCTFAIGLPLNIIALFGVYQLRNQPGLLVTYTLNLIITDLCNLVTLPLWIEYFLNHMHWVHGKVTCLVTHFVFYIDIYIGVYFLTWTAIDRYLAIVHPLRSRGLRTKKFAVIISICGWLFCSVGGLPFMLLFEFVEDESCFEMYPPFRNYAILRLVSICFVFFLPCVILCFTYGSTLQTIQRTRSLEPDEKKRIQQLLMTVGFIFLVFFGPYHIVYTYRIIVLFSADDICHHECSIAFYLHATLAFMTLNNVFVPVLYIFVSGDIRRSLCKCCGCIKLGEAGVCYMNCIDKLINRNRGNPSHSEQELHRNPAN